MEHRVDKGALAERFDNCTFLFAKVVGLAQIITRSENDSEVDPTLVVNILQLIFDRFGPPHSNHADPARFTCPSDHFFRLLSPLFGLSAAVTIRTLRH